MGDKGQQTKEKILASAMQLFSRQGYFHSSIPDLMKATGLTQGGIYGHFPGKRQLWIGCYHEASKVWKERVFTRFKTKTRALDKVLCILEDDLLNYLALGVFQGGCFFSNMLLELSGQEDELAGMILEGYDRFEGLLAHLLEQAIAEGDLPPGLDCQAMGRQLVVWLNGAALLHAARQDGELLQQTFRQMRQYLLQPATSAIGEP